MHCPAPVFFNLEDATLFHGLWVGTSHRKKKKPQRWDRLHKAASASPFFPPCFSPGCAQSLTQIKHMLPELPYGLPSLLTWQPSLVVSHGSSSKGCRACRLRLQLASPSFLFIIWIHLKPPWKLMSVSAQKSDQWPARFQRLQVASVIGRRRTENGNQGPNSASPQHYWAPQQAPKDGSRANPHYYYLYWHCYFSFYY